MNYRNSKITNSANGECCTVLSPVCNGNHDTVVWAHSNLLIHGKGKGIKAHDWAGCYACSACHDWLDNGVAPKGMKMDYFFHAMSRSLEILFKNGIVK